MASSEIGIGEVSAVDAAAKGAMGPPMSAAVNRETPKEDGAGRRMANPRRDVS